MVFRFGSLLFVLIFPSLLLEMFALALKDETALDGYRPLEGPVMSLAELPVNLQQAQSRSKCPLLLRADASPSVRVDLRCEITKSYAGLLRCVCLFCGISLLCIFCACGP